MSRRVLGWFSCGATSTVASALALAEHGHEAVTLAYIDTGSEHADNLRYLEQVQAWLNHEIVQLRSNRYSDTWDVWERTRFLNGPTGARCTGELKRRVRARFERPDDLHVFGYAADPREVSRATRFREQHPGVELWTPLIERGLTKRDCLAIVERQAGIDMPEMYRRGYVNNNCVPCVKGGIGYWNKIRRDFPAEFERMAKLERSIGATVLKDRDGKVWLDQLDPDRGSYAAEEDLDCSLICSAAEATIARIAGIEA